MDNNMDTPRPTQEAPVRLTQEQAAGVLSEAVGAMTTLIESNKENTYIRPDNKIPCPEWDAVNAVMYEVWYLPERADFSGEELTSAVRAHDMLNLMKFMLGRMRRHAAFSESTMNGDILSNRDKLRDLVEQNEGHNDMFAQLIDKRIVPFYTTHMVNAIRRNATRLPGGSDGSNIDIKQLQS